MWNKSNQETGKGLSATLTEVDSTAKENALSRARVDKLVSTLANKYRAGEFTNTAQQQDEWSSRPVTLVLMDIESYGNSGENNRDALMSLLPQALMTNDRVTIVEREILEKLLEELELGSSDLTDPITSLKIGRILSASIIITGRIIPNGEGSTIILRAIDTETTAVKKVISIDTVKSDIDSFVIDSLSRNIIEWIRSEFPLRGKITSLSGKNCQINLGQVHGLKAGDKLEILNVSSETSDFHVAIGEIEISEVGKDKSTALINGPLDMIKEGFKVRENRQSKIQSQKNL
jgi:hypothetical protein